VSNSSAIEPPRSERRARPFWRKPWPLRTALGLFALSLVLPAVLFFGLQYRTALAEKQAEAEREGLAFAHEAADDINRELQGERKLLKALATSPWLLRGDDRDAYKAFQEQAVAALKGEKGSIAQPMIDLIEEANIPIAMVGLLYALPNTQLTRRLAREGRLYVDHDAAPAGKGDQCTAGVNYETKRPRLDILRDYRKILEKTYDPDAFCGRGFRI